MIYTATQPDGKTVLLPQAASVHLNRAEEAPADGFTGVFPLERSLESLSELRVFGADGTLCFDGIVDEQRENVGAGRMLTVTARGRAALLLDNEALPQNYGMPSLKTVFERHIKPYGFSDFKGNTKVFPGELKITKGMSEWQAAQTFCRTFLKTEPVLRDGVFDASGIQPEGNLLFDRNRGIPYSSVTVSRANCRLYSELFALSANGGYTLVSRDDGARALGVRRRRFLAAGTDVDALTRSAQRKAFSVTVLCPGEIPAKLGIKASVCDRVLGTREGLYVSEMDYQLSANGEYTRFTLRRLEACG